MLNQTIEKHSPFYLLYFGINIDSIDKAKKFS